MFYKYDAKEHELVEAISNYIHGKPYGFNSLEGLISNIQSCAVCHKHHSLCKEDEIRLTYFEDNPQKEYIFSGGIIKSIYKVNVGGLSASMMGALFLYKEYPALDAGFREC